MNNFTFGKIIKSKFLIRIIVAIVIVAVFTMAYLNDHKAPLNSGEVQNRQESSLPPSTSTDSRGNIGTSEGDGTFAPLTETEIGQSVADSPTVATSTVPAAEQIAGQIAGQVCFGDKCYGVELATTPAARESGLMFRKSLDKNQGMLFEFGSDGVYKFWMKNTLISLDMVWIGADKKIISISNNISPCIKDPCPLYGPETPARYVFEVNGGEMKRIGAKIGDIVVIK